MALPGGPKRGPSPGCFLSHFRFGFFVAGALAAALPGTPAKFEAARAASLFCPAKATAGLFAALGALADRLGAAFAPLLAAAALDRVARCSTTALPAVLLALLRATGAGLLAGAVAFLGGDLAAGCAAFAGDAERIYLFGEVLARDRVDTGAAASTFLVGGFLAGSPILGWEAFCFTATVFAETDLGFSAVFLRVGEGLRLG